MQNRIVEGVVAVIEREGRMLVIRRAPGILAGGCWCLPGGGIEPGESRAEAVAREVREEVGLIVRPVREIWQWRRADDGLRLYWWLARLADEQPASHVPELTLRESEVSEAQWVTRDDFRRLHPILESNLAFMDYYGSQL